MTTGKTSLLYTFTWIYRYLSSTSLSQVVSIAVGDESIQKIQRLHQKMFLQIYYYEIRNAYVSFKAFMKTLAHFVAFWELTPCRLKNFFQPFWEMCSLRVSSGQILCRKIPKWLEKEMCFSYTKHCEGVEFWMYIILANILHNRHALSYQSLKHAPAPQSVTLQIDRTRCSEMSQRTLSDVHVVQDRRILPHKLPLLFLQSAVKERQQRRHNSVTCSLKQLQQAFNVKCQIGQDMEPFSQRILCTSVFLFMALKRPWQWNNVSFLEEREQI